MLVLDVILIRDQGGKATHDATISLPFAPFVGLMLTDVPRMSPGYRFIIERLQWECGKRVFRAIGRCA